MITGKMIKDFINKNRPESNALAFVIVAGEMPSGVKRFSVCSLFRLRNEMVLRR